MERRRRREPGDGPEAGAGREPGDGRPASEPGADREPGGEHGDTDPVIRAAGCVLWRRRPTSRLRGSSGGIEVAVVHRPKYDDWSHPKGKLHPGEDPKEGAVREVREETGLDCVPGQPLPTVRYEVNGRPKEVRYWAAEAGPGAFVPNREVDRLLWLRPDEARERLTHQRDRELLDALLELPHLP